MTTLLSHPAVPLAIGLACGSKLIPRRLLCVGILCSMLPDIDVLSFRYGIPYASEFGHRGFTHSIGFALLMGGLCMLAWRWLKSAPLTTFCFLAVATLSHAILDAFTNGGLGVAFLWPLNNERYFFPWQVIQVSPIGMADFWERGGWTVLKSELIWVWLPALGAGLTAFTIRLAGGRLRRQHQAAD